MGLFDGLFKRNKEDRSMVSYGTSSSGAIFSTFSTSSQVTEEEAMRIPSVVACVELVAGSIAQLPIHLHKENEKGEVERITGDPRIFLLNSEPNELLNGYNFKKRLVKDYLFYGVSYTKIEKDRNKIMELNPIDMRNVQVTKYLIDGYKYDADIKLTTYGMDDEGKQKIFKPYDMLSVLRNSEDGITGTGALQSGAEILRLALNENEYTSNILKNGALPIGVIQTMGRLSDNAIKRLRAGWESLYGGSANAGKTVILEEGLEYKPISLKPNDLQLIDSKKITISEIARLFNVPESMLNADANKYASNEQNNLHFLQYTLAPIITSIERALDKSLLLESEKNEEYYFRFDTTEILRTTEKERIEAAAEGLDKGFYSLNETRSKFDMPKLEDDYFMWSLGHILFNPETKEMYVPNMQGSSDLDDGPVMSKSAQEAMKSQDKSNEPIDNKKQKTKDEASEENGGEQ